MIKYHIMCYCHCYHHYFIVIIPSYNHFYYVYLVQHVQISWQTGKDMYLSDHLDQLGGSRSISRVCCRKMRVRCSCHILLESCGERG